MKTYTLTEVIAEFVDGVEFSEDRQFMAGTFMYYGDSIDFQDEDGEWYEDDFITQDFILREDIYPQDYECDVPYRTHGYEVYDWYRFKLPPNRKRGDRYTVQQLNDMIVADDMSLNCKGGFDYYNMPDEEE